MVDAFNWYFVLLHLLCTFKSTTLKPSINISDQLFEGIQYHETGLHCGEYDHCTFKDCIFSQVDLSYSIFTSCRFENCDLSNAKINGTAFRQVVFKECKMLGLRFDLCNTFLLSFAFDHCLLNFSSFYLLKIKNTQFRSCTLQEVDFSECDLTKSSFAESDLSGAIFDQTNLEQADFATAYHFNIIPENNKILKAKFSKQNIEGLLSHYKIIIE